MKRKKMMVLYAALIFGITIFALAYAMKPTKPLPKKQATNSLPKKALEIEVRKNASLSQIAHDLGTSWRKVAELNQIKNPDLIFPGQKIKVFPFDETNIVKVSWYGPGFHGKTMANGKIYNMNDEKVVAHKWLPFNTKVRLTRIDNNKSITAIVQDRGPYVAGRIFDLSYGAAKQLGMIDEGLTTCKVQVLN